MTLESCQAWCQIFILIGVVVAAGATYGDRYFTRKASTAAKEQDASRLARIDQLIGHLEPFEQIAQQMHPTLEKDKALNQLREDFEKFKNQAQPRTLSEVQRKAIIEALKSGPTRELVIESVMGDQEAFAFATILRPTIELGGWKVTGFRAVILQKPLHGLEIVVRSEPPPDSANELFRALRQAGLNVQGNLLPSQEDGIVHLRVGSK